MDAIAAIEFQGDQEKKAAEQKRMEDQLRGKHFKPESFFDVDRSVKKGTMVTKNVGALNKLTTQATKLKVLQGGVQR